MSGLGEFAAAGDRGLINISIHYQIGKTKNGSKKIVVLSDEDAEKILEKERAAKEEGKEFMPKVETFNTKWRPAVWQDQNRFVEAAQRINQQTQQVEINWNKYRDLRIKALLVDWDLEHQGQKIPVSGDMIDKLPPEIVLGMYNKYEEEITYSPEDEEK